MTDSNWVVRVQDLGKCYEIYRRPHHRLLQTLFRGRRKFYREFWALRGVTLSCARGETLGIIGRNGSGKSTLLQLVAGTLFSTEGSVQTRGRVAALLELGSGFNPDFTGRENVYLNSAILGRTRDQTDLAFEAITQFADIGDFIEQPIGTYSSGMTMRLAFAVAVHSMPDLLIVDEALSVGDTAFQSKCLARIRQMQAAGVAILFVSHSSNTVLEFCTRTAYLVGGRLRMVGPTRDVLEQYANDQVELEGGVAASMPLAVGVTPIAGDDEETPATAVSHAAIQRVTFTDGHGNTRDTFRHGDTVVVTVDALFHEDNPAPCLGIQVRTVDDIVLWATTTLYMRQSVAPVVAGATVRYTWRLRADVGSNRYVVGLGVGAIVDGTYRRQFRLHYAGHFDVLSDAPRATGWLDLDARFEAASATQGTHALPSSAL